MPKIDLRKVSSIPECECPFMNHHKPFGVEIRTMNIDVSYLDGSHEQILNVMAFGPVNEGVFSYTYDVKILLNNNDIETRRIHYVTDIQIVSEEIITRKPSDYQLDIMSKPLNTI